LGKGDSRKELPRRVVLTVARFSATAARARASNFAMEAGHALSTPLGKITIASGAIAQIVEETARECYGVVGMKGSIRGRMARGKAHARGIEVGRDPDGGVTVDLHVVVEYGLNLAEVASTVRNRVAYEVGRLTGLAVRSVEVHVDAVRTSGK
jgi:uncharacterized alkaline shock family protein YloU